MKLLTAGGILATSVIVKMICGLILVKLFALYLSVGEFGQVGQYMTLVATLTTIAGGAQTHGLIKMLSAAGDDVDQKRLILRVSHTIAYISTAVIIGLLLWFSTQITSALVGRPEFAMMIIPVVFGFFFAGFNNIQISVLSASGNLKHLAISQALGIVAGTTFTAILLLNYGVTGAIAGFATIGFWNAMASGYIVRNLGLISFDQMGLEIDGKTIRELLSYSAALVLAILMMPSAHLYARSVLSDELGWQEVGYWQAIIKISDAIVQIFGTFFNNYMLVILARLSEYKPTKEFLTKVILGIIAVSTVLFTGIFLFRNLYITLFLSSQYHQIGSLLPYQFAGDIFRLVAAVGSYYFLAKKMLSKYVGLEVLSALIFSVATTYFIIHIGNGAAVFAHLVTYASIFFVISTLVLLAMYRQSKQS